MAVCHRVTGVHAGSGLDLTLRLSCHPFEER